MRIIKKIISTALVGLFLASVGTVFASHVINYKTSLTSQAEVPPVSSPVASEGSAKFKVNLNNDEIEFKVKVKDASKVTQAHLHCGAVDEAGPIVAYLFGEIPGGFDVDGKLADFTLTADNIVANACTPVITTMDDLVTAIGDGNIYVNVHTVANPNGELRGQLGL